MLPCYSPYLNAFPSVVVPAKKPVKKPIKKPIKQPTKQPIKQPIKQPLKSTLLAPLASSICSISNTLTYLYTTSVTPKAFTVNKYRKPSAPPPLGPPKPS